MDLTSRNGKLNRLYAEELMAKYRSGLLTKLFLPFPDNAGDFSSFKRRGSDPSGGKSGPRMYQPDGARYKVRGQHVEYMDWSFDFRIPPIRNVQLFDVRFQGQRIAYEISMQEMSSYYSGLSLHIISSSFADTAYMFTKFELVKGVDCPFEASYVDTYHLLDADEVSHRKNVIGVFEYDSSAPLARHYANDYDGGYTFYGGVSDYYLVLRTITSVYNYDFITDVCFHNNGVVHVKVATTGYIMATYDRGGRRYSFPVHSDIVGSLHHHMYSFKLDLDILGESNRFASYDLVAETIPHPWIDNANKTQAYFKKIDKLSELDARVFYDFDQPRHYVIYSNDSTNSFGTKRGYRIVNDGMTKLLLPDEDIARNIRWGKYQLAVSKYKDEETFSSSPYNLNVAMDPLVDFDSFLSDDESIVDEDLVVWLTTGKHHLPTSEDVPAVSIAGKYRTFSLLPFNYFDEGPEVSSRDGVVVVPDGQHGGVVDTFGSSRPECQPRHPGPLKYDGTW